MSAYGVSIFNIDTGKLTNLYSCIEKIEEAELLAQLEMSRKADKELVVIMPGWNRSIYRNCPKEYNRALELADEYSD